MLRYKKLGYDVHFVCATKGEAGKIRNEKSNCIGKMSISEIRVSELEESCEKLGVKSISFLELIDGQSSNWNTDNASEILKNLIEEYNIKKVISFDSKGINGHPDHVATTKIVESAVKGFEDINLIYATKYPRKFLVSKLRLVPNKITKSIIEKFSTDKSNVEVFKLDRKELKTKLVLLEIYRSQFPDDKNRYYQMPKFVTKYFARYESYEVIEEKELISI